MTHSGVLATILSGLEPAVAIVLACIPLMRPLLGHKSANTKDSRYRYNSSRMSKLDVKEMVRGNTDTFPEWADDTDASSQVQLQPIELSSTVEVATSHHEQHQLDLSHDVGTKKSWKMRKNRERFSNH
jgi:hypothetical protein